MLEIHFEGWFQCRLASGPADPVDETRGVSGWTFAVGDEPDLDRVIRFQDFVSPRSFGPDLGVFVTNVTDNGTRIGEVALEGARVDLLHDPKFVGRNGILFELAEEPIDPFHIRIVSEDLIVEREDIVTQLVPHGDQTRPQRVEDVLDDDGGVRNPRFDLPRLKRRLPTGFRFSSPEVGEATGILDFAAYRQQRAEAIRKRLDEDLDEACRLGLQKRLRELEMSGRRSGLRQISLGFQLSYAFELNGRIRVEDPERRLKGQISTEPSFGWPIEFWLGAWDADALAGFVKGVLKAPYRLNY